MKCRYSKAGLEQLKKADPEAEWEFLGYSSAGYARLRTNARSDSRHGGSVRLVHADYIEIIPDRPRTVDVLRAGKSLTD